MGDANGVDRSDATCPGALSLRTIVLTVPTDAAEIASDRLWVAGARAVEERTTDDGSVELRTSLGGDDDLARARLGAVPPGWFVRFVDVDLRSAETWKEFAQPVLIGDRLVLHPAWLPEIDRPGVLTVLIDPGGAFGLGDHPTTRLAAAVVDDLVRPGQRVLDVGCGTGVLSIVAAMRGASRVVAIDIADDARQATIENAARNGVAANIDSSTASIASVKGTFDLVLANILAPALVSMAPGLRRLTAVDGRLVVSGLLTGGYDHVVDALRPMRVVEERHLDGWSAVTLVHEQR